MILKEYLYLIDTALKYLNLDYPDIKMLEFGCQMMRFRSRPAKEYFYKKNIHKHISIDLSGKYGAQKLDLNKPITKFPNVFDISTDFGTIEHLSNQYQAFKNIHDMTRVGGYMIHALPMEGYWTTHCPYHYEPIFFYALSDCNKYSCKLNEVVPVLIRYHPEEASVNVIMKKKFNAPFISEEEFKQLKGLHFTESAKRYSF